MKAMLRHNMTCEPCAERPDGLAPAGTVIDHPDAYKLVQQGCAIAHDSECGIAAGMWESQLTAARKAYDRVYAGIHPEDFEAFDAGVILGYEPDGSYKPGPNWVEPTDECEDEEPDTETEEQPE